MGQGEVEASSSIGRAAVSKTAGWGFDSLLACHERGPGAAGQRASGDSRQQWVSLSLLDGIASIYDSTT